MIKTHLKIINLKLYFKGRDFITFIRHVVRYVAKDAKTS